MTYNIVILDTVEINTVEDLYLFLNRREDNKKMEEVLVWERLTQNQI